jgi:hypothetical protein
VDAPVTRFVWGQAADPEWDDIITALNELGDEAGSLPRRYTPAGPVSEAQSPVTWDGAGEPPVGWAAYTVRERDDEDRIDLLPVPSDVRETIASDERLTPTQIALLSRRIPGILSSDASILATTPSVLHYARSSDLTIAAGRVTNWLDISGNDRHAIAPVNADDQPTFEESESDDSVQFHRTDADGEWLELDTTGLNNATHATVATAFLPTDFVTSSTLWNLGSRKLCVQYWANSLYVFVGSASNFALVSWDAIGPHMLIVVYDGTFTDADLGIQNAGRLKLYADGDSEPLVPTFQGTIPASLGAVASGRLGHFINNNPMGVDVHLFARWDGSLSAVEVAAVFDGARELLSYSYRWVPLNTALPEYTQAIVLNGAAVESYTGHTASVVNDSIIFDNIVKWVGFPSVHRMLTGQWRSAWRSGHQHGDDPSGQLLYSDSVDDGVSWAGPSVLCDEQNVDDRGLHMWTDTTGAPVDRYCRVQYTVSAMQDAVWDEGDDPLVASTYPFGFPLRTLAHSSTAKVTSTDGGRLVAVEAYSLLTYVPKTKLGILRDYSEIRWLTSTTHHLFEPAILKLSATHASHPGRVLLVCRTGYPTTATSNAWLMHSDDDGVTWSEAAEMVATWNSPHLMERSDGVVVLMGRWRKGGTTSVCVQLSADGGDSWTPASAGELVITGTEDSAQGESGERSDGSMLYVYYTQTSIRCLTYTIEAA